MVIGFDCPSRMYFNDSTSLAERRTPVVITPTSYWEVQGLNHFCHALLQFLHLVAVEVRSTLIVKFSIPCILIYSHILITSAML